MRLRQEEKENISGRGNSRCGKGRRKKHRVWELPLVPFAESRNWRGQRSEGEAW